MKGMTDHFFCFQCMNWGHQQCYWVPDLKGGTSSPRGCALYHLWNALPKTGTDRKADVNPHEGLQLLQRYKDTNHSRFRKYTELKTGRHQESIRALHTLPLFVPFNGH